MSATKSTIQRPAADVLRSLYVDQQLGCPEIGRLYERDAKTVHYWLQRAGIPTRPRGSDPRQHFKAGHPSAFAGRSHGPETRQRIGAASVGRAWARGDDHWLRRAAPEDNPNWKGGATPERQEFYRSAEWKAAVSIVWTRDNATCRNCFKRWPDARRAGEQTFHIHHVWSFQIATLRANPAILVLLCRACHLWVHSRENTTRAWLPQEPEATNFPALQHFTEAA